MTSPVNHEFKQIIDSVARDKNIEKEDVITAIELAVQVAARKKYGHENDIVAKFDQQSGDIKIYRQLAVTENPTNFSMETSVEVAKNLDPEAEIGSKVLELLPPIDLGRVPAKSAEQIIVQKIREAEKVKEYDEYIRKVGQIINGVVKRIEHGNIIVEMGRSEAIIPRNQLIRSENYKPKERVRALIAEVKRDNRAPQIILSRTHPDFLAGLFTQEVPEIYDNIVEVKSVVREPGSRAKIAVYSADPNIDPVGSCVGIRGARVQAVISELQGEKIDIVVWSEDPATFVINALSQTEVTKVIVNEEKRLIEVVVPEAQLSIAIGRRGQNVRLAAQLTGWKVDVMTEEVESKKRMDEFETASKLLVEALDVEDVLANLLVTEGFLTVEDVTALSIDDIQGVEGVDEDLVAELRNRALSFLNEKKEAIENKMKKLKIADDLQEFTGFADDMVIKLGENDVKTIQDVADLATDEMLEILEGTDITERKAAETIMKARNFLNEQVGSEG